MARLPIVNKHFRVLRFVAQRSRESAVIFVCVREYDAAEVGNEETGFAQSFSQRFNRLFRLRSGVDDRQRIFGDQVDVYRTDVERRWQ
jgi:hypothetical protein